MHHEKILLVGHVFVRVPRHLPRRCRLGSSRICVLYINCPGRDRGQNALTHPQASEHHIFLLQTHNPFFLSPGNLGIWPSRASPLCHPSSCCKQKTAHQVRTGEENRLDVRTGIVQAPLLACRHLPTTGCCLHLCEGDMHDGGSAFIWHLYFNLCPVRGFREAFVRIHELPPSLLSNVL